MTPIEMVPSAVTAKEIVIVLSFRTNGSSPPAALAISRRSSRACLACIRVDAAVRGGENHGPFGRKALEFCFLRGELRSIA